MLYLAYGSNLDKAQMDSRCPDNKVVDKGLVTGWKLCFEKRNTSKNSYATIKEDNNSQLPVVLFEISESDKQKLDEKEGVPNCYKIEHININLNGKEYKNVLTYIQNTNATSCKPLEEYLKKIQRGYEQHGLDVKYLKEALKNCPNN